MSLKELEDSFNRTGNPFDVWQGWLDCRDQGYEVPRWIFRQLDELAEIITRRKKAPTPAIEYIIREAIYQQNEKRAKFLTEGHFSRAELSAEIGVSVRTLDRWHSANFGPRRMKIGRQVFYQKRVVAIWLESNGFRQLA